MAFPETIAIMVRDAFDGPVRGYRAELVAPSTGAGATFAATLSSSDVSDASGVITLDATANGIAGSYVVGVTGAASGLALTNTVGALAVLEVVSGSGARTVAGTAFPVPIVFRASDAFDNPLAAVTISLALPSSGASATPSTSGLDTGADGTASVSATANDVGGSYELVGSAGTLTASASLTNQVPTTVTVISGADQTTRVGTAFAQSIVIRVQDQDGAPIAGVAVTLTPPGAGASATFAPTALVTDAAGLVTTFGTANAQAGTYGVGVAAGGATTTFALTNTITIMTDAGVDAGTGGGVDAARGVDAGGTGGAPTGGCGCALSTRPDGTGGLGTVVALIAMAALRRRPRRPHPPARWR